MTTTSITTTTPEGEKRTLRARAETAQQAVTEFGRALGEGRTAYVAGTLELVRTLGGFGQEIVTEAGEHARATVRAKGLREVAELQAAFAQRRIEMSATHTKEFVDLARARSEEVIAPLADFFKPGPTA